MQTDLLVIGAGILGVSIAREWKRRNSQAKVLVLEKEERPGQHASGRNSGVLHAGFYYTADSLKAKWTRQGNQELKAYCKERKLSLLECGKLVVTSRRSELSQLQMLLERGEANGVPLKKISVQEARELEPRVQTVGAALYSPETATVNPSEVMASLVKEAEESGIRFLLGEGFARRRDGNTVVTTKGSEISAGYVVNAAGLHADVVAQSFGFGEDYGILPFIGKYLMSNMTPHSLKRHIYPVPDLNFPFLGVHFTLMVDGRIKIGPTALPAFGREQYAFFSGLRPAEAAKIGWRHLRLVAAANKGFKKMALVELQKRNASTLVYLASKMLEGVSTRDFSGWGKPGIRAQLVNLKKKELEMDFIVQGDEYSMHVLNAVSPGFTCALPFARHVCDRIG